MQKKCVPAGQKGEGQGLGKGQGKGPLGQPRKEMFAADFPEEQKVEKTVDVLVDSSVTECGMDAGDSNAIQNVPAEEPEEELSRAHDDIAGYGDPEDEANEYPPGPQDNDELGVIPEEPMARQFENILMSEENDYQVFFRKMMDEEGVKGIKGMSMDQKKSFFKKVSAEWKKKKGMTNEQLINHLMPLLKR